MTGDFDDKSWNFAAGQAGFVAALQRGPSAVPPGLFSGTAERTILGLKTHANTISHARLVALEETYPRLRSRLGEADFNALSRRFVERPDVMQCSLLQIGQTFPDYLMEEERDAQSVDLARIEWNWLESYHAPDAEALTLANIASLDEAGLLDLSIILHPSVRVVRLTTHIAPELSEIAPADTLGSHAVMISRPKVEVRLMSMNAQQDRVIEAMRKKAIIMADLLTFAIETYGETSAMPLILGLIEQDAVCKANDPDVQSTL
jgi:hypothetical protein